MADVLAVIGKGGSGKTTTVAALGERFAAAGRRTLLVDLDAQGSLTDWLAPTDRAAGPDGYLGIDDAILGAAEAGALVAKVPGDDGDLALLPVGERMPLAERAIENRKRRRELALADLLAPLADSYDLIVLDAPKGNLGMLGLCALEAADHVLIPFRPSGLNLFSLRKEVGFVRETEAARDRLLLRGLLPCDVPQPPTIEAGSVLATVAAQLRGVLPEIRRTTKVEQAAHAGRLLGEYAPTASATADYARAATELLARIDQPELS